MNTIYHLCTDSDSSINKLNVFFDFSVIHINLEPAANNLSARYKQASELLSIEMKPGDFVLLEWGDIFYYNLMTNIPDYVGIITLKRDYYLKKLGNRVILVNADDFHIDDIIPKPYNIKKNIVLYDYDVKDSLISYVNILKESFTDIEFIDITNASKIEIVRRLLTAKCYIHLSLHCDREMVLECLKNSVIPFISERTSMKRIKKYTYWDGFIDETKLRNKRLKSKKFRQVHGLGNKFSESFAGIMKNYELYYYLLVDEFKLNSKIIERSTILYKKIDEYRKLFVD